MRPHLTLIAAMLLMAVGTFAFRLAGPILRLRIGFPSWADELLKNAAIALLAGLVATTALTTGHGLAGFARPAGVAVGAVLAWRRAPFLLVVLAAAGTTALLRLPGS